LGLLSLAYRVGTKQESRASLDRRHVALAVGTTALLAAVIASRLFGVGSTGAKSDAELCADYCRAEGFVGSGMPPRDSGDRTCTCYDAQGHEARRVPLPDL
jgi:hypothetical protein